MKRTRTIYLVDDDEDDRMLIREALENVIERIHIVEVADGKELVDMLADRDSHPDLSLIIMDMNMPRMGGLEALTLIKSDPYSQHIPVVMVSTTSNPEMISQSYEKGINAFITKPVSTEKYNQMAEAVNVCFLNRYPASKGTGFSKSFKESTILVIEDNADHWDLMNIALKQSLPEINVIGLRDRASTLKFLNTEWHKIKPAPQLVVLDLYLPTREDGLSLLDAMRSFFTLHKLITVPIIIFSYSDHEEDIKDSYRHRANAYMMKYPDISKWVYYFQDLCQVWWETVTLPKKG